MNKIGKLGNLGELKHLDRDAWIVMAINSIIDKQNEIIDELNQDQKQPEGIREELSRLVESAKLIKLEKQEEWKEKLGKSILEMEWECSECGNTGENGMGFTYSEPLVDFIEQLLGERSFTKDELFMLKLATNDIHNKGNRAYDEIGNKIERLLTLAYK